MFYGGIAVCGLSLAAVVIALCAFGKLRKKALDKIMKSL